MATFTNTRKAPDGRIINGKLVWVQPGETIELDNYASPEPEAEPVQETDKFDTMDEDALRAYLEEKTGDKPHWKASVETLREKARAL